MEGQRILKDHKGVFTLPFGIGHLRSKTVSKLNKMQTISDSQTQEQEIPEMRQHSYSALATASFNPFPPSSPLSL